MSYEAEKTRLIQEFETVVATIRADWGLKTNDKSLESKTAAQQQPRTAGRH
ncbi:hypothetical protein [Aeromicrobium fastidiosum]|uniref:hypothetical protein n=1 Tax=Aeromicrobium fastidiosum TaxID=52699 RepID=UPI00165F4DEC|nr:hypothetical protein [Aeromicrobium fastidiosum]MBP2390076.1 hypothetical protein [Aeromicrobium fastidiosum]